MGQVLCGQTADSNNATLFSIQPNLTLRNVLPDDNRPAGNAADLIVNNGSLTLANSTANSGILNLPAAAPRTDDAALGTQRALSWGLPNGTPTLNTAATLSNTVSTLNGGTLTLNGITTPGDAIAANRLLLSSNGGDVPLAAGDGQTSLAAGANLVSRSIVNGTINAGEPSPASNLLRRSAG